MLNSTISLIFFLVLPSAHADGMMMTPEHHHFTAGPGDCESAMEVWDVDMNMCMPLPMQGMAMNMLMLQGNAFGVGIAEQGPRGQQKFAAPDMYMIDAGRTLGDHQYVNLDFMGTFEKWVYPESGYPELLQIGESRANGTPFIDDQHPHSTPIMGLTLSDTIRLNDDDKNNLKISIAPRGQSTDGPIAFMHRVTGMANPDAPLGHHIGQDVGHITSTVVASSLQLNESHFEISAFHGAEPDPTRVDLPIGAIDSGAFRFVQEFSPTVFAMASAAYLQNPEPDSPDIHFEWRYSTSVYSTHHLNSTWTLHDTLIYGLITQYDHASSLSSFTGEFLFEAGRPHIWGRIEVLQRTPAELEVTAPGNVNEGRWVTALTLGYTHEIIQADSVQIGVGASATKDFLPSEFISAYGSNPWTGKLFVELSGMKMGEW
jgi:hypothetical protein